MTFTQCLMARAALGWSIQHLAEMAGLNYATIRRFEGGRNIHARSRVKIESALANEGLEFFDRAGRFGVSIADGKSGVGRGSRSGPGAAKTRPRAAGSNTSNAGKSDR